MTDQHPDDQATAEQPQAPAPGWSADDPTARVEPSAPPAAGADAWAAPQHGWQTPQGAGYPAAPSEPNPWGTAGDPQPTTALPAWQQPAGYGPGYGQGADYPAYGAYGQAGQAAPGTEAAWAHDTTAYVPTSYPASGSGGSGSGYGTPPPAGGTAAAAAPAKPKSRIGLMLTSAALVGLLAGTVGGYVGTQLDDSSNAGSSVTLPQATGGSSERAADTVAGIAARVSPAVVSIEVSGNQGSGTGSGFVIREDGYILTNNHVVESAASGGGEITVNFSGGESLPATIVGRDTAYDLAVIKVDSSDLPAVTLGDSDSVVVGDSVIAIGSPLGLAGTVTAGIVSALNRPVTAGGEGGGTSFINAIQTDAAINPGNSGGALVNAGGQVIGVNSAIATLGDGTSQSGSIGLGFAIPINQARRIAEELIDTGSSTKPIIGVHLDTSYTGEGAKVQTVTEGSPAEKAGFQDGDVIVEFNGKAVADATELIVDIRAMNPGDTVEVKVQRGSDTETLKVTLGSDSSSN